MPNYDYTCEKCHRTFEFFQSMKDEPLKICPESACCKKPWGKGKVKRQIGTGAGLIFKGSGFYITDYRSENYKSGAKSDTSSASGSESSKPETPKPSSPSDSSKTGATKSGKTKSKSAE